MSASSQQPKSGEASPNGTLQPATLRHVFVYGTLRQGDDNDITQRTPAPLWVGRATIAGKMYHLGAYPGVLLDETTNSRVHGEVYAIEPALERELDELEEVYPQQSEEYFKREIAVEVAGQRLMCIVYEVNPRYVVNCPQIASGDWIRDRHS